MCELEISLVVTANVKHQAKIAKDKGLVKIIVRSFYCKHYLPIENVLIADLNDELQYFKSDEAVTRDKIEYSLLHLLK
jgi:hypothetical protein